MRARLLNTKVGQYEMVEWDGVNRSGIRPLGEEVLVLSDKAVEQTRGGIILTASVAETQGAAAQTGVIVAIGDDAWTWNTSRTKPFNGARPKAGDRVVFQRYSGIVLLGLDGVEYRLMTDSTIGGMMDMQEEPANG